MNMKNIFREKYPEFYQLCREYRIDKIYAFGSSVSGNFDDESSDIDIIVSVDIEDAAERGDALISFWNKMEVLFGRKVDLLTEASIHNPYLKSNINRTKKLIYDRKGEKVFV